MDSSCIASIIIEAKLLKSWQTLNSPVLEKYWVSEYKGFGDYLPSPFPWVLLGNNDGRDLLLFSYLLKLQKSSVCDISGKQNALMRSVGNA